MAEPSPVAAVHEPDPVRDYQSLWRRDSPPDLVAYLRSLASVAQPTPAILAAVLHVDLSERRQRGEHVSPESYLRQFPEVTQDDDAVVDFIFGEFLLREQLGEKPMQAEYLRRFPLYVSMLKPQLELHEALQSSSGRPPESSAPSSPGSPSSVLGTPGPGLGSGSIGSGQFGRYRIVRRLAKGGMGSVYQAYDTVLDREVALKIPHASCVSPAFLVRFYREARIAAMFRHPHLCPVYDVGQIDGVHFLAMPLVSRESLADRLKHGGALLSADAVAVVLRLAQALEVSHAAGVIHRDLKPANIALNDLNEPVIMDFGLARRDAPGDARATVSGVVLGTPLYIPPEQIGVRPDRLGPQVDVYGLGMILYEALTGRPPFRGTVEEILKQTLTENPRPPSHVQSDIPKELDAICLKALAKNPNDRYASMQEFVVGLQALTSLASEATASKAPSHRSVSWLTLVIVAIVLFGLGLAVSRLVEIIFGL